ncbi:hypothetical protein Tco_0410055 [Tanacetum coccineum]
MTTPSNNNQMHNDIMAASSRERPPMLALGHYAQWSSRFMRYVDTKANKNELRHCIKKGLYILPKLVTEAVRAVAEAIHMILNGIGDDIYSMVDACSTAREMWLAIERLQQRESINKQDAKTKLFWEFGKFTSRDAESVESYYSRFYKMMNEMSRFVTTVKQQKDLDIVSYHTLFDILKQHQNEVNEIHANSIARNANLLALVAAAQHYPDTYSPDTYYQAPKPYKTNAPSSRQTPSARTHATTRN